MSELLLRDQVEIERQRDAFKSLDRVNRIERELAVLEARFQETMNRLFNELERSVSDEDLKQLKREWEGALRDAMSIITETVKSANDQQSHNLLSKVELMLAHQQQIVSDENKRTRQQFIAWVVGFALAVLSGMTLFWMTGR